VPNNGADATACSCSGVFNDILIPVLDSGSPLIEQKTPSLIRETVLQSVMDLAL